MDKDFKLKLRLKGLLSDHWKDDGYWSYKVNVSNEDTVFGMKRFAIQHPRVRGYMNEWYYHQILKHSGVIALRYEFKH